MSILGRVVIEYNYSAFEHYEFTSLDEPACYVRVGPDHVDVQFWYLSSGQEGDECILCDRDLSHDHALLLNRDYSCWRLLCMACWDKWKAMEIVERKQKAEVRL